MLNYAPHSKCRVSGEKPRGLFSIKYGYVWAFSRDVLFHSEICDLVGQSKTGLNVCLHFPLELFSIFFPCIMSTIMGVYEAASDIPHNQIQMKVVLRSEIPCSTGKMLYYSDKFSSTLHYFATRPIRKTI
jgi:hypothetical protein